MRSPHRGRQDCRPEPRPLKPEERAGLHRVALHWRAVLRGEILPDEEAPVPAQAVQAEIVDPDDERRARYAAAVARAEFGRFYCKEASGRPKPRRKLKPRPNGVRPD